MFSQCIMYFYSFYRHDVADIAGVCAYAFGEDEVDRYVMVFKKVRQFYLYFQWYLLLNHRNSPIF